MRKEGGWMSLDKFLEKISTEETERKAESIRDIVPDVPSRRDLKRMMEETPSKSLDSLE